MLCDLLLGPVFLIRLLFGQIYLGFTTLELMDISESSVIGCIKSLVLQSLQLLDVIILIKNNSDNVLGGATIFCH